MDDSTAGRALRRDAILEAIQTSALEERDNYLQGCIGVLRGVLAGQAELSDVAPHVFTMLARALVFSEAA